MKFNPPPGWPISPDWSPPPQWQPHPSWPPAPPGWQFWIDDPHGPYSAIEEPIGADRHRTRKRLSAIVITVCVVSLVVVGVATMIILRSRSSVDVTSPGVTSTDPTETTTNTAAPPPVIPDWPVPGSNFADFTTWTAFGGIDARYGDNGRSVVLDTHDTTDTWRTKWSGLIQAGPPMCSMHLTGRVRDLTHAVGTPGGFGIGLASIDSGNPADVTLSGNAIQFDFGQNGYRMAAYPSDGDYGLEPGVLDNEWHDIEVIVTAESFTLSVDGQLASTTPMTTSCGQPVIRVWAGAAEFSSIQFR